MQPRPPARAGPGCAWLMRNSPSTPPPPPPEGQVPGPALSGHMKGPGTAIPPPFDLPLEGRLVCLERPLRGSLTAGFEQHQAESLPGSRRAELFGAARGRARGGSTLLCSTASRAECHRAPASAPGSRPVRAQKAPRPPQTRAPPCLKFIRRPRRLHSAAAGGVERARAGGAGGRLS